MQDVASHCVASASQSTERRSVSQPLDQQVSRTGSGGNGPGQRWQTVITFSDNCNQGQALTGTRRPDAASYSIQLQQLGQDVVTRTVHVSVSAGTLPNQYQHSAQAMSHWRALSASPECSALIRQPWLRRISHTSQDVFKPTRPHRPSTPPLQ